MASLNPNADPFLSEGRYLQPEDGDGEDGRRRRVFHGASVVDARRPLDESNDRRRRFFLYRRGDPWQQTDGQSSDDQSENRPRTPKVLHGRLGQGSLMVVSALVADVARRHFAYFYSTFFCSRLAWPL